MTSIPPQIKVKGDGFLDFHRKGGGSMGTSEAKKVLAGFGIAALLAGVALTGCKSGGS